MRRTLKEFTGPALSPGSWWRQCPAGYHSFAHLDRRWWTGGTGLPAPASWSVQSERITLGREMALSSGAELWSEPLPEGDWVVDSTCWCLQRPHLPDRSWEKPAPMAGHSGLDLMWRKTPKESLGAGWLSGASVGSKIPRGGGLCSHDPTPESSISRETAVLLPETW